MKVLLINPPRFNEILADNPAFIDEERGFNPPLGLLYLSSYLKANSQHQVFGLDAQVEELDYNQEFENRIKEINPDLVGITAMTFTLFDVLKTIELVKKAKQDTIIVLGGPHAHLFPKETASLKDVDFVIKGEGEIPFLNLLTALEEKRELANIDGLTYQQNGEVIDNPVGELISDLDQLPFPDRELLPIKKYNSILGTGKVVTTMFTSRGCPFRCAFCDRPHLGKKFRARSAKGVVDEMERCLNLGIDEILVYDDTFSVDRQRTIDICDEIINRGLKFTWDIRARVDTVDQKVLSKLSEAGCARIHFGVEAGTEKILKVLNKGIHLDKVEEVFALARKNNIKTLAYFMIGAPTETEEDINQSIEFAKKIKPDYLSITILTPYPATEIYRMALEQGVIKNDYWREFAKHPEKGITVKYWEKELTRDELFDLNKKFYKQFYVRPSFILNELLEVKSLKDLNKKLKIGFKILFN